MKKIILCALALGAFSLANAQITTDAGTFTKPVGGTTIFEVNMTPDLTGGGIFSLPTLNSDLGLVGIKVRKFKTDTKVCRWGANLSVVDSGHDNDDTDFAVGLSLGVERHRAGAERLSTYWGYEANIGYVSSDADYPGSPTKKFGVGASLFTGFDYYIMPKIYLGTEISYGIAVTNTNPEVGDSTTKCELSPGITPSLRLGWQF